MLGGLGSQLLRTLELVAWWVYKRLVWPFFCWLLCLLFDRRPGYEPQRWNDPYTPGVSYGHQYRNNCYNYSCNKATDTFAQPGYAHGAQYVATDCPSVSAGAQADGLTARPDGTPAAGNCCHTVALVMAPGYDYHWYRLDTNGMWSHKPGGTPARNTDNSNNLIADPRVADRGVYTQFCGFFTVCRCSVEIDGPFFK
jgi:hypothetical protein